MVVVLVAAFAVVAVPLTAFMVGLPVHSPTVVAPPVQPPTATPNDQEAARLYKLAADQGDAAAQYNLGVLYAEGRGGLAKNDQEAVRLYKLAADQGHAAAQYSVVTVPSRSRCTTRGAQQTANSTVQSFARTMKRRPPSERGGGHEPYPAFT
jgi:TPR repeat protein